MQFTLAETASCQKLVELALEEDLGGAGDLTSEIVIPHNLEGNAVFVARAPGVVAGLPAAQLVFSTVRTPLIRFQPLVEDGAPVKPGDQLARVNGLMQFILAGERTALNFLQRLGGIATLTRRYVDAIAGLPCLILDTRKTTPGWRLLEKYAVRCGGGQNHRMGLYDAIMIKDNHLASLGGGKPAIYLVMSAVAGYRSKVLADPATVTDEAPFMIELESPEQLGHLSGLVPDIVLLDNMSVDQLREVVRLRTVFDRPVGLEASGGVTLENVRAIAETGVDRISVGALTHSAPALDIALDYEKRS
jgi:nicotinate-nucleotide pyrophosphorylase (carboxylating)